VRILIGPGKIVEVGLLDNESAINILGDEFILESSDSI